MQVLKGYFSDLTDVQINQFCALEDLYKYWNSKINVISRKDIDQLYLNHVLHSLAIAKVIQFSKGTRVLDVGTGGGFPGVPLAILFPQVDFTLLDSIGKKIKVVDAVSSAVGLKNIRTVHSRVEGVNEKFDFVVSRAVAKTPVLMSWVNKSFKKINNNTLENGLLLLKGGYMEEELFNIKHIQHKISDYFDEDYFDNKKIIYIANKL